MARAVADLSFFREASLLASDWLILQWRVILGGELSVKTIKLKSTKIEIWRNWNITTELIEVKNPVLEITGEEFYSGKASAT